MRSLSAEFATAARLYAESVINITRTPFVESRSAYDRLRETIEDALRKADIAAIAFYEHIESHQLKRYVTRGE
jgi:hypothetical protein